MTEYIKTIADADNINRLLKSDVEIITAYAHKSTKDNYNIYLNNIIYIVDSDKLYFDGNFSIYHTLTASEINRIKNFLLDDKKEAVNIDRLYIVKTNREYI